jgi:hypothetical protein
MNPAREELFFAPNRAAGRDLRVLVLVGIMFARVEAMC